MYLSLEDQEIKSLSPGSPSEHSPTENISMNSSSLSPDSTDRSISSDAEQLSDRPAVGAALRRVKKGNLKTKGAAKNPRRVSFDPLALLLDAALEGELELVKKTAKEVSIRLSAFIYILSHGKTIGGFLTNVLVIRSHKIFLA